MADVLYFRGLALGDHMVAHHSSDKPLTPPVMRSGLFQQTSLAESQSTNLISLWTFRITIIGSDHYAAAVTVRNIRAMQNLKGLVEFKVNGAVKLRLTDFLMMELPEIPPRDGFGGRLIDGWPISFAGDPTNVREF